jgi:hypothetical protein
MCGLSFNIYFLLTIVSWLFGNYIYNCCQIENCPVIIFTIVCCENISISRAIVIFIGISLFKEAVSELDCHPFSY